MQASLVSSTLTLPKERTYFVILLVFSCLVWLVCALTIVPIIIAFATGFMVWLLHGVVVARIKSEGVKLDADQMPELNGVFANVCAKLGVSPVPELYLMQQGGALNAFATRHSARDFVVLYSDLLEAYGAESDEIKFLLGHELGHIRSRHILKTIMLLPGLFLPLLGSAYNRACESSCDRHGAFASEDAQSSVRAMMILSGGKHVGRDLVAEAFSKQHHHSRGFFVSLHELFSSYPTLSKRVSDLLDIANNRVTPKPRRNILAVMIGLFLPGARFGVFGVVIVFYVILILGSSLVLPLLTKMKQRAEATIEEQQEQLRAIEKKAAESLGEPEPTP
jgi:Zn-dependent protease with chaperone function